MKLTEASRDAIAEIITQIAAEGKEGVDEGRALDAALDAIEASITLEDDEDDVANDFVDARKMRDMMMGKSPKPPVLRIVKDDE